MNFFLLLRLPVTAAVFLMLAACTGPDSRTPAADSRTPAADQVLLGAVFDSRAGRVIEDGVVTIRGDRIACVGEPDDCGWPPSATVRRVDEGMILPGLIDAHAHSRVHYAAAYPGAGITTIRDATSPLAVMRSFRQSRIRPRLFTASPMIDGPDSKFFHFGSEGGRLAEVELDTTVFIVIDSEADAGRAVAALAGTGIDWIKLYDSLEPGPMRATVAAARAAGLPVMVDLGLIATAGLRDTGVDILDAARAGVDSIEHLGGLALAYQRAGGDPMAEPVDPGIIAALADALAGTGVTMVPTLALLRQLEDPRALSLEGMPGMPALEAIMAGHMAGMTARYEVIRDRAARDRKLAEALLVELVARGVPVVAGSDSPAAPGVYPGVGLHLELDALVQAGLAPAQALQAATINAATLLRRNDLGVLEPGAVADIIVVSGNPVENIRDSRRVEAVYMAGEPVDLDEAWSRVRPPDHADKA